MPFLILTPQDLIKVTILIETYYIHNKVDPKNPVNFYSKIDEFIKMFDHLASDKNDTAFRSQMREFRIGGFDHGQLRTNIIPKELKHPHLKNDSPYFDKPDEPLTEYDVWSAAAQMFDGSWVGWTVYNEELVSDNENALFDWINRAYYLRVLEEEVVRKFETFFGTF